MFQKQEGYRQAGNFHATNLVNPNIKLVEEYNYSGGPGSSCLLCFLLIALQRVNELSASPCIDQDNYAPSTSYCWDLHSARKVRKILIVV
jgi:hypothetical protein